MNKSTSCGRAVMTSTVVAVFGFVGLAWASAASAALACAVAPRTNYEMSLQQVVDGRSGSNSSDASVGCLPDGGDTLWTATNGARFVLGKEEAGFKDSNIFGIYDPANPSDRLAIFLGANSVGDSVRLSVRADGDDFVFSVTNGHGTRSKTFSSSTFGFYLQTPAPGLFFSDTARNADGTDHLYVHALTHSGRKKHSSDRGLRDILAWEDLAHGGDLDYDDLVVFARGLSAVSGPMPVPLPAALWLLVSGVAGLGAFRRRQSR